jgi:hypothetical protein
MKYNNTIEILKFFGKALLAPEALTTPWSIPNNSKKSGISNYSNDLDLNNNMNNSVYSQDKSGNKEYNESAPLEASKSYNDNKSNGYYNKQQNTSSDPQGVIDSITQEITPVRLQQAIILSEIVGKPRSKTRKKRRF